MSRIRSRLTAGTVSAVLVFSVLALAAPANAHPPGHGSPGAPITVATGLNNPRQISVDGHRLYVAEAGTAESCAAIPGADPAFQFCGLTGSVTEVRGSQQRRVVTGLPAMSLGEEVIGASDAQVRGRTITVLVGGMSGATAQRDTAPEYAQFGTLRSGRLHWGALEGADMRVIADLAAFENVSNPDGNQPTDSNAVGFTQVSSKRYVVADAGGNTVLSVRRQGVNALAVLPPGPPAPAPGGGEVPPQAVPTDVAVGPDGAYYVSQLTGFPFPTGGSTIWRVTRDGDVSAYATGLTTVTSLAWKGNRLYAVQIDDSNFFDEAGDIGSLRRVTPGGSTHEAVIEGLSAPYGLAIRGGSAYLTIDSVSAGGGSVIRVDLR